MYNYGNQYMALVGGEMDVPGNGYPGGVRPTAFYGMPGGGAFTPGLTVPGSGGYPAGNCSTGDFYPPGCSPCGPSPAAMAAQQEQYNAWCRQQQAMTAAAARVAIMKELPTVAAPANSVTVGGILSNGTEAITVTAPVPLCIIDWDVSRICSSFFTAVSLVCALVPYLVTSGEMQLDVFASDAIHPTTNFPQIIPGTPLVLTVHNISAEPHAFFSTFHGIRGPGQGPCLGYNQGLYGSAY